MNRTFAVAIVDFILGLLVGSSFAPVTLWPKASLEKDNAILSEQVRLLKRMLPSTRLSGRKLTRC